ncbi:MAG: DUF342 domain-containing protein, partial [Desulfobacteraceae bacterium]|nr:DUF342 domain-containing protein [Desulfobacteraceae bacterium]
MPNNELDNRPGNKPDNEPDNKLGKNHKIVLVKTDGSLFIKVKEMLEASQISTGYEAEFVSSSEYIDHLSQKKIFPPSFVICIPDSKNNYKNIFTKVKKVFPETRRMLITESDGKDQIIESLNMDAIHFCLALPFSDSDFLKQLKAGFSEIEQGSTWEYIKRILDDQNLKMYKIAKGFQEKDEGCLKIADQKKEELKRLQLEFEKLNETSSKGFAIEEYISSNSITLQADDFKEEFKSLAGILTKIFEDIASKNAIGFLKDKYSEILNKENKSQPTEQDNVNIRNDLLFYVLDNHTLDSKSDSKKTFESDADNEKIERKNNTEQAEPVASAKSLEQAYNNIEEGEAEDFMALLDHVLDFVIDDDRLRVYIYIKDKESDLLTVKNIFEYLRLIEVNYGLITEQTLLTWIESKGAVQQLIAAQGTPPEPPVDGKVTYHFNTDFIHAGKVKKDGSIDFRERGSIPFVEENVLLAEKIPAKLGKPGIDISGAQIAVTEPIDPVFVAGDNTFESEGGMKIFAKTGGQPHLDAMGSVSVAPVLNIDSDVDYETGNISFKGSIVVNGAIKEGFKVEGTNLTAEQIESATVHITGDLNVSSGITDSDVKAQGNVQAKYINNSRIETFGDLVVTTEVLDSTIYLSGKFNSGKARIIGSKIVAKAGVEVGQIGTIGSEPVKLKVGVDDYIIKKVQIIDKKLLEAKEAINVIKNDISDLNKKDEEYFKSVSESAYIQDRTQLEIKDYKEKLADLKESGNAKETQIIINAIKKLEEKADHAEKMVENALDHQDKISDQIVVKEKEIEKAEEKNIGFVNKKKALKEYSEKGDAFARVIVNG